MTIKQKLIGPPLVRAAQADVTVIDEESRRLRLSFSSEQPYLRSSFFDEPWVEVLGHDADEVDLSRMDSGNAPLLWGHDSYSRSNNIGVVERAWIEKGRGYADVRFSRRDDVLTLFEDVKDGVVTNVSVGYQIQERTLTKENDGLPNEYRVTRWLPIEISLVSVPADASVGVGRSDDAERKYEWADIGDKQMSDNDQPAAPATEMRQGEPVDNITGGSVSLDVGGIESAVRCASLEAIRDERERVSVINDLTARHGLGDEFARTYIENGANVEAVRSAALSILAERSPPTNPRMSPGRDEVDKIREAETLWLLSRESEKVDGKAIDLNGNEFRGSSLLDVARRSLSRAGERVSGLTNVELASRAISHSTSDFPVILQNVMHKTLLSAYENIADTWRIFCATGSLSDFRPHYRYRMGSFGNLATVKENGEYTYGTLNDAERESITGETKGKLLNISRTMVVNDDLGAFASASRAIGRGAARTVEVDVYALLDSNPTMGDGVALFHADHANLNAAGAAPTVAGFDAVRQAMATQFDVGENDYTDIRPSIWLGPIALGSTAREINAMEFNDESNKFQRRPNVVRGLFSTVVDTPRLSGNIWYAFANPSDEPVLEVGFLNGQQTPYTEMQNRFNQDGITWKIRLDYGVAAVGWRGAYKVTY